MNKNYNINFHQTFPMELRYLASILGIAKEEKLYTKEEISEITGIPTGTSSGKVVPHIEYAKYCCLIEYTQLNSSYKINLTNLGKLVYREDKYLKEKVTKDLLFYFLTSQNFGADQFYYLTRELLKETGLMKSTVSLFLKKRYEKNNEIKNSPILTTLNNLKNSILVDDSDESLSLIYKKASRDNVYVYAYTLLKEIESFFGSRKEIDFEEIIKIKWREGHLLSESEANKVFEWLEDNRIIKINKQLTPATLIFIKNENEILNKIYEELL